MVSLDREGQDRPLVVNDRRALLACRVPLMRHPPFGWMVGGEALGRSRAATRRRRLERQGGGASSLARRAPRLMALGGVSWWAGRVYFLAFSLAGPGSAPYREIDQQGIWIEPTSVRYIV